MMVRVRHVGGPSPLRHAALSGPSNHGDEHEVSAAAATYLCDERGDFERVDDGGPTGDEGDDSGADAPAPVAPLDPSEYTVDELRDALVDGDYSVHELKAVGNAEERGQDRTTALEAVDTAIQQARTDGETEA
jgi:hypothetical protein